MTDTQGFYASGKLQNEMIDRSRLPIASGQGSLRIQDRNKLQEKITNIPVQNDIYYDIHHKNNFFNDKDQYYDFKDPIKKVDEQKPIHLNESRLQDKKNYTNQIYKEKRQISKENFQQKLEINDKCQNADNKKLYQISTFISRPELKLEDKQEKLVNSRCPNHDFPDWGSNTNKLYIKENLPDSKQFKNKLNTQSKNNIFGITPQQRLSDRQRDNFCLINPDPNLINEKKRMIIKDKTFEQLPHTLYKSKIQLKWDENQQIQTYDKGNVAKKIGQEKYYAQKIQPDISEYPIYEKKLLVKEKAVLIKIGHGEAEKWIK